LSVNDKRHVPNALPEQRAGSVITVSNTMTQTVRPGTGLLHIRMTSVRQRRIGERRVACWSLCERAGPPLLDLLSCLENLVTRVRSLFLAGNSVRSCMARTAFHGPENKEVDNSKCG
jgi:hypothetical protein